MSGTNKKSDQLGASRSNGRLIHATLGALSALLATFGISQFACAAAPGPDAPDAAAKSVSERVKIVRERIAAEREKGEESAPLYRLSQFINFPNFPNFPNFNNFRPPGFPNFPNFPNC
jgi:hypothetical protein